MNDYTFSLDLDFYPLNKPITDYSGTNPYHRLDSKDINPKLHDFLKQHNLAIANCTIFYRPKENFLSPHTDFQGGDYVKLLYVYGGKDSKMIWYKIKDNIDTKINTDAVYQIHQFDEVEKIYEDTLLKYNIVQVGIPHTILNSLEPRWCLTMVLEHQLDRRRVTMQEIKNILSIGGE